MDIAFPGESAEYRAARDRLLDQEIELRRAMEAVAAARRRLPPGGVVLQDYIFQGQGADGGPVEVRLSELFASPSCWARCGGRGPPARSSRWPAAPPPTPASTIWSA
jgi:predicted dithiol-disulfide oxidoreductase (DUF899 family)